MDNVQKTNNCICPCCLTEGMTCYSLRTESWGRVSYRTAETFTNIKTYLQAKRVWSIDRMHLAQGRVYSDCGLIFFYGLFDNALSIEII
jgi:hypothetical protein